MADKTFTFAAGPEEWTANNADTSHNNGAMCSGSGYWTSATRAYNGLEYYYWTELDIRSTHRFSADQIKVYTGQNGVMTYNGIVFRDFTALYIYYSDSPTGPWTAYNTSGYSFGADCGFKLVGISSYPAKYWRLRFKIGQAQNTAFLATISQIEFTNFVDHDAEPDPPPSTEAIQIAKTPDAGTNWAKVAEWSGYTCTSLKVGGAAGNRKLWVARVAIALPPPADPTAGTPAEAVADPSYYWWIGAFGRIDDSQAYFYYKNTASFSTTYRAIVTPGNPTVIGSPTALIDTDLLTYRPQNLVTDEKPDGTSILTGTYGYSGGDAAYICLGNEDRLKGLPINTGGQPLDPEALHVGAMLDNSTLVWLSSEGMYVITNLGAAHNSQTVNHYLKTIPDNPGDDYSWYHAIGWRAGAGKMIFGGHRSSTSQTIYPAVHVITFDTAVPPVPTYQGNSLCPYAGNYKYLAQLANDEYFMIMAYNNNWLHGAKLTLAGTTVSWGEDETIWEWYSSDTYQRELAKVISIDAQRVGILWTEYDENTLEYSFKFATYTVGSGALGNPVTLHSTLDDILGNPGFLGRVNSSTILASYYTEDYKRMVVTINV